MKDYINIHKEGEIDSSSTYTAPANPCKHDKGWYHTIEFWIFSKRIFICEKCFTVLDATRKKVL